MSDDGSGDPTSDGWPGPWWAQVLGWTVAGLIVAVCVYIAVV